MGKEFGISDPSLAGYGWYPEMGQKRGCLWIGVCWMPLYQRQHSGSGKAGGRWAIALAYSKWEDFPSSPSSTKCSSKCVLFPA